MKNITSKILAVILTLSLLLPTFACSTDQVLSDIRFSTLQTGNASSAQLSARFFRTDLSGGMSGRRAGSEFNGIEAIQDGLR